MVIRKRGRENEARKFRPTDSGEKARKERVHKFKKRRWKELGI